MTVNSSQEAMDASKSARLPDPEINLEEYWSAANELLSNKNDILHNAKPSDEDVEFSKSIEEILCEIDNALKNGTIDVNSTFRSLVSLLADLLDNKKLNDEIGFKIVKIVMKLSSKNVLPLESISYVSVVCFLLRNCKNPSEKTSVAFMKHLKKLSNNLEKDHVKTMCLMEKHRLLPSLKVAFTHLLFCTSDSGIEIIGAFVALDAEFIKAFHEHILRQLLLCKKPHALSFGKIYFQIWNNLPEEEQPLFEEDYIQWFMNRACTLGRSETVQKHLLANVQSLLKGLHESRRMIKFTRVITKLYTPILWKYLNSNNSIHRCNAAEVLMDAYPLEKPREGEKTYSKNLRKQHDEMLQLLDDPCPAIRVVAIRGICLNMQYFWVTFQNGTAELVLKKFVSDLVIDGSSYEVRKAVYQGLTTLFQCEDSHVLLKHVLPLLKDFIHDENQSVRQAFIFMLLKIKEYDCKYQEMKSKMKEEDNEIDEKNPIKYYNIVNMEHFAARLANDTPKNRQLIVRLIFSSFFNEKLSLDDSYLRVCKFIKVNAAACRYLAMYSKSELEFKTAVDFMVLIMRKLSTKIEIENESSKVIEQENSQRFEVTKSDSSVLNTIENVRNAGRNVNGRRSSATLQGSNQSISCNLKNVLEPHLAHGLLDFIGMLWLVYRKTLKENTDKLNELYTHCEKCYPIILRYFRGTHAFFGALNVASMIPFSKIYGSTTIAGTCKAMLLDLTLDSPSNEFHSLIHALCRWNRGGDIIELSMDGIDEAFRAQSLNESAIMPKTKSGKRVKFVRPESNPMLALRILDELFSSPSDQDIVFTKDLEDLKLLLRFLSKIKILVERRIEKGFQMNNLLSDAFLSKCLTLYGNLIIMFNENKVENYDFWEAFSDYLSWSDMMLAQSSQINGKTKEQTDVDKFAFDILQVPLKQCINLIALGKSDKQRLITILRFVNSLLDSAHGLHFVELVIHMIKQLLLYTKVHQDEFHGSEIMITWFPEIVEKVLAILSDEVYSKETLMQFLKDSSDFKRNLIFIYVLTLKLYPEVSQSSPSYKIMHSYCQSLINIVLFPITECETLNIDHDVKSLPFVGTLMAAIFISQLELASALFYVLKKIVENYTERDALKLLACSSLLYTFAFSKSKLPKPEIVKVVKMTYNKIQQLSTEEGCLAVVMNYDHSINDRTIIDVEDTTERAVKEIGLHILVKVAEELGGSLGNTNDNDGTSRSDNPETVSK